MGCDEGITRVGSPLQDYDNGAVIRQSNVTELNGDVRRHQSRDLAGNQSDVGSWWFVPAGDLPELEGIRARDLRREKICMSGHVAGVGGQLTTRVCGSRRRRAPGPGTDDRRSHLS